MSEATLPGGGKAPADLGRTAEATIARGSKSFAAAARLFDPGTRQGAIMLYAWCRHCDDVVDDQELGHRTGLADATAPIDRVAMLEDRTRRAFAGEAMAEPAFQALQQVASRHDVPLALALEHLDGFRMDAEARRYERFEEVLDYCHHVAGVVGVMMARVMGARDAATLVRAADLGLAFQLTNIARDIVPDAAVGRVYLPADWLAEAGLPRDEIANPDNRERVASLARRLVAAAEPYYASARIGIDALPRRSAWAVATALGVYREIGLRVVAAGPRAWDGRVSTSRSDKLGHVATGAVTAFGPRRRASSRRDERLWTHALPASSVEP
ncbi:phytoene/squalene synthase family protein [Aureimonas sp. Leaf454]|uniref:phytoene/squalene synthase family protein n=1 Tax=Aureimonas sp. Leaf454 TaxID=1736381 RepID=UPI001FCE29ED|nr:phytoene/squalene synthase family protein [Aureimonas sp. Leaf454]